MIKQIIIKLINNPLSRVVQQQNAGLPGTAMPTVNRKVAKFRGVEWPSWEHAKINQ